MNMFEVCKNIRGFQHIAPYAETLYEMWKHYDYHEWERDLSIAQRVGANTLRYWLSPKAFIENSDAFMRDFDNALQIAWNKGMLTIPSIFNAWAPGDPEGHLKDIDMVFPGLKKYETYVRTLINRFSRDSRVLMWEICNEPECVKINDEANHSIIIPFLEYWYAFIKGTGAMQPVSVGTMWYWNVERYAHCMDVLNFHTYETDPDKLNCILSFVKDISQRLKKPIFCSETGMGFGGEEAHKGFVKMQTSAMDRHGIGFILPWLVEGKAADTCDAKSSNLGNLALFRTDGSAKAAGSILNWDRCIENPIVTDKSC